MIVTDEKQLRVKSEPFMGNQSQLQDLVCKLVKELNESENPGVGLAAIQIGIPLQVGIIRTDKLSLNLVNPKILDGTNMVELIEGCLSFPGKFIDVRRMESIKIENQEDDKEIIELTGFEAQAVQHEIDHFNGLTMFDRRI